MTALLASWESQRVAMSFERFAALPDTHHSEYIDGSLVVNPPTRRHIQIARRLTRVLEDSAPDGLEVLPEAGWLVGRETVCVPDILVASKDAPGEDMLRVAPILVVEVASRSTRGDDLGRKRDLYARGGARWYWVVDPDDAAITVLHNVGDDFVQTLRLDTGRHLLAEPFALTLDLSALFGAH